MVVITAGEFGQDEEWLFAFVVPTSTEPDKVTPFCVRLESHGTWARVPAAQPLEKADLEDLIGLITPAELEEIYARLVQYLGLV